MGRCAVLSGSYLEGIRGNSYSPAGAEGHVNDLACMGGSWENELVRGSLGAWICSGIGRDVRVCVCACVRACGRTGVRTAWNVMLDV